MGWRRRGVGIFVLWAFACGKSDGAPTPDGGATNAGDPPPAITDAGSEADAENGADADASLTPSFPAGEPPPCPDDDACNAIESPFSVIYEAPANIEFRQAGTNEILAYDREARRFVLYDIGLEQLSSEQLVVRERFRFDARYDRVIIDPAVEVLACEGASCDLRRLDSDRLIAHVPGDVHAVTLDRSCVAGTGIMCFGEQKGSWSWVLRPDALEHPIIAYAGAIVADDHGGVFVFDRGYVKPIDLGTKEPVVSLSARWHIAPSLWTGRTAAGQLLVGSDGNGRLCEQTVDLTFMDFMIGYVAKRGDRLTVGSIRCARSTLPLTATGVGVVACGIAAGVFAFDAHRIYGHPFKCWLD